MSNIFLFYLITGIEPYFLIVIQATIKVADSKNCSEALRSELVESMTDISDKLQIGLNNGTFCEDVVELLDFTGNINVADQTVSILCL